CIVPMDKYVALLKDHHSGIGFNLKRKDLSDTAKINAFKKSELYRRFTKIAIDTASLIPALQLKKPEAIEGIYSNGGNLVFGIIPHPKQQRKYIGLVVTPHKLVDVGHVLLELEHIEADN